MTSVVTSLGRADLLASSMDLRGFSRPVRKTFASTPQWRWWHLGVPLGFAALTAVLIFHQGGFSP